MKELSPVEEYWAVRLAECKQTLEKNNFSVFLANSCADAKEVFLREVLPTMPEAKTVAFGGSMTLLNTGVVDWVRESPEFDVVDTFDKSLPKEEVYELRRQALLADVFLTGTNALTECGKLVNLDMIGNRVGAITFGPRNVVLFIGRNKLVRDVDEAILRIKEYASPVNTMRLGMKTPCRKTGHCMDCSSPSRICNVWSITEKAFPQGRIKIVLINEDAGL